MNNVWKSVFYAFFAVVLSGFLGVGCGDDGNKHSWEFGDDDEEETDPKAEKPRYIWIDAAANFPDFANSKENIARDLGLAKESGFTDIVVDVRPTNGDVLFKTTAGSQVEWLGAWVSGVYTKVNRTATWDYLQAFIDEGHRLGLRVHAGFNTFVGGNVTALGNAGVVFRDDEKAAWVTYKLSDSGIHSALDEQTGGERFFNPVNEDVQNYICDLLEDLAAYEGLDGIILDRGRFEGLASDFSDYTRKKFEAFLGHEIADFPGDVMRTDITEGNIPSDVPVYFKKWLEFRVKVVHDFMVKARTRIKARNPEVKFGVYVGGWYSTYYANGVNWASPDYNTSLKYSWATADYKNYGYADHMDQILIGAYAAPTAVYGNTEWTIQGFCRNAMDLIKGAAPVIEGPDVGNGQWATAGDAVVNQAITKSVDAAIHACDGYFLFDMIHLKQKNQWQYVKQGIDNYLVTVHK